MPNPHLSGTTWGGGWAFFPRTPQSSNQKEVGGALDWTLPPFTVTKEAGSG